MRIDYKVLSFLVFLLSMCFPAFGQEGSVCIAPVEKPNNSEKTLLNPAGENKIKAYYIQIDQRPFLVAANDHGTLIRGLDLQGRHAVNVRGDGKAITAFHFTFSRYSSTNVCVLFNSLYETWSMVSAYGHEKTCACGSYEK